MGAYSHQLRIVACPQCAAPIEGSGGVACGYCNTVSQLAPRRDSADRERAATASPISEAQRIDMLRAQDGQPVLPPPELQHLLSNPASAKPVWLEAIAARRDDAHLYSLTLLSAGAAAGDDRAVRALIESALDVLSDARHRQVLHAMLARAAARDGELDAANSWLALVSPCSTDIPSTAPTA